MRGQQEIEFSTRGSVIMIVDWYLARRNRLKLKLSSWWICFLQTCSFSLHKMLIDELEWCGLLVDYCDVFISCLDSHSDGTHSLQRIHQWASDVILHFSKSDEETNSSTSQIPWGWVKNFRWTIHLRCWASKAKFSVNKVNNNVTGGISKQGNES